MATAPSRLIFGLIPWYSFLIVTGAALAVYLGAREEKRAGLKKDTVIDFALWALPIGIIGARIYYVAFSWDSFKDDLLSVMRIWEGGIAIYGGVIGAVLGLLLFAKVKKQKLTPYLDMMALGLLIGQCVGRWGNFFNREAHGAQIFSRFFLRMGIEEIPGTGIFQYWHPTFLYESVWNLIGFILLHFLSKKRKFDGQTFLQYLAWYGLGRVWIEGLRTDSLYITGTDLRVSQLLAGVSFVAAVGLLLYIRLFKNPDGSGMLVNRAAKAAAQGAELAEREAEAGDPEAELAPQEAAGDEDEATVSDEPDAPLPDEAPESDEVPDNEAADPDAETTKL